MPNFESSDDIFIPSNFDGENLKGKVTKDQKQTGDSTDSAAEALRKLRQNKKKKD